MSNTNSPSIKAEIVSAPAITDMIVTPVGTNMFGLNLHVVLAIRFTGLDETSSQNDLLVSTSTQVVDTHALINSSELIYANREKPESDGEASAFQDFVHVHSYPPPSRQVLSEWVQSQQ